MANKDGYDRIEYLREVVNEGEQASILMKFLNQYLEDVNTETLRILREETDKDKVNDAISYYRAVVRFCDNLAQTAAFGERKEKTLIKELKK